MCLSEFQSYKATYSHLNKIILHIILINVRVTMLRALYYKSRSVDTRWKIMRVEQVYEV